MTGEELVDILDTMSPIGQYGEGVLLIWRAELDEDQTTKHLNYWRYYRSYALDELKDNHLPEELFNVE